MANPIYGQNKFDAELDSRMLRAADGTGIHEYYEEVKPTTAGDNDVAVSLSIKLPIGCIILDATLVSRALATSDHGLWALEVHTAAVADDAASLGGELGIKAYAQIFTPQSSVDSLRRSLNSMWS